MKLENIDFERLKKKQLYYQIKVLNSVMLK